ncbi:ABC transporter, ATP-binding protein [Methanosarcina horonobensis HB-1 = JCM 15518]|uniref:ABC transporter, ATP-binding protein n=2 Tax=Methanosarcina horonobensis TaxID=418008 RepID=A0A0E3SDY0_9EURY|nr:ABC transporter ATP-binding protein [Methanosarcina horonobensis]AKB78352.1 ABC transporter, ATP-binding protein [Methanosarcina horonobensis HB-1 = JCM 15518]
MIEVKGLSKSYGQTKAVDIVDLSIGKGELFGLLGPNGSGKTTMIKMLTGQLKPTSGTLKVHGINVLEDPLRVRELVGVIPEQETPPSFLTAEEYLHFVAKIRKMEDYEEICNKWFEFFDFGDQRNLLCKDLSRGTRQKLMFAQAFLHEPELAIIDEPLINLDPVMQRKVKDFLQDYVKNGGTIFISTHILEIAKEICTNIGIIYRGKLVYTGHLDDTKLQGRSFEGFFLDLVSRGKGASNDILKDPLEEISAPA